MNDTEISRRLFIAGTAGLGAALQAGCTSQTDITKAPPARPQRPRLYFTSESLPALRQRFESDPKLRGARGRLIQAAEAALEMELPDEQWARGGRGQHSNYYRVANVAKEVVLNCAFAFALTGQERFAQRAIEGIRHFAGYEQWTSPSFFKRDRPWQSALETARLARAHLLGIDCLGEALSGEDLQIAMEALMRLGVEPLMQDWIDPAHRVHALDSMGHNWWMVCVGAAGLGALTLLEHDKRAEQWLKLVVEGLPQFFSYPGNVLQNKIRSFDPDGGFYESLAYAGFTLRYYFYLHAALKHMFPNGAFGHRFDQLAPQVNGMAEFMLHFIYPVGPDNPAGLKEHFITAGFGDDSIFKPFNTDAVLYLAGGTGDGRYRWYFDRYCKGEIDGFYQMLFYDPVRLPAPKSPQGTPLARALHSMGWASLRDSWNDDSTFLAIKCGDTWNHTHADAGSFVIYAGGEPLLMDPSKCTYGRKEYIDYYVKSRAHNVVLLDGKGQPERESFYRGSKFRGRLYSLLDAPNARYVMADATGPFASRYERFLRHFLWLDNTIILVDDLMALEAGHFEWLFHGWSAPEFRDGTLTIAGKKAQMEMNVLFPKELEAHKREGLAAEDPDTKLDYLTLRQTNAARDTKFLGVIRAGRQLPELQIEPRAGDYWIGTALKSPKRTWKLYCNLKADGRSMHDNSNLIMDHWDTDAFLLATRIDPGRQAPRQIFLAGGSYLRTTDGKVLFDSLSKCDSVITYGQDMDRITDIVLSTPPHTPVRISTTASPKRMVVNRKTLSPSAADHDGRFMVINADST